MNGSGFGIIWFSPYVRVHGMWSEERAMDSSELRCGLTCSLRRRTVATPLVCLLVWVAPGVSFGFVGDDSVGFVLEKHGDWLLEGKIARPISEGDRLPAGAKVRPKELQQKEKQDSLTICLYTGQARVYTAAATLPVRYDPSLANRIWCAIVGRYSGGYVHALSRGSQIADGVVRRSKQTIDLSAVFHPGAAGEYRLRFRSVSGNSVKAPETVTLRVDWSPKQHSPVRCDELRPGIYECAVVDEQGQPKDDSAAWILVSESFDYERAATTYRVAVDLSEKWEHNVSPYAVLSFRRACLQSLAASTQP